jgi:hypothetical protein
MPQISDGRVTSESSMSKLRAGSAIRFGAPKLRVIVSARGKP